MLENPANLSRKTLRPACSVKPDGGLSKREFLRQLTMGLGGLVLGLGISNCGPSMQDLRRVNEGIEDVVYDCNPILPIPKRGCYTGTNEQSGVDMQSVASLGLRFKDTYGLAPAFNAPGVGKWGCANDDFPKECEAFHSADIIPMLRYVVSPYNFTKGGGFREIAKGASDEYFKRFAAKAAEFGKVVVLVPWQCVNEPLMQRQIWPWSRADPSEYKAAWVRMHDIFQREGANKNVVWSTKMINWGFTSGLRARDPFDYIPDAEFVDIVGWNCNANLQYDPPNFYGMFASDYKEAAIRFPTKPQAFWELGAYHQGGQSNWMDNSLSQIKESFPRVKVVMFDVHSGPDYIPAHTDSTEKVIKKHFSTGYFLGSALK